MLRLPKGRPTRYSGCVSACQSCLRSRIVKEVGLTCSVMAIVMCGFMIRLVPPAMADSHSPRCIARQASCSAVNEEEQAVRVTTLCSSAQQHCTPAYTPVDVHHLRRSLEAELVRNSVGHHKVSISSDAVHAGLVAFLCLHVGPILISSLVALTSKLGHAREDGGGLLPLHKSRRTPQYSCPSN